MIYVIQAGIGGPVKIGVSGCPSRRMRGLQTGNPSQLRLIASADLANENEKKIHDYLESSRLYGEWFALTHETIGVVSDMLARQYFGDLYESEDIDLGAFFKSQDVAFTLTNAAKP